MTSMNPDQMQRLWVEQGLKDELKSTMEERIARLTEIAPEGLVAGHHFSAASAECIKLYRDGYFISAVMVSQAVNEGMIRFVAERNNISPQEKGTNRTKGIPDLIDELEKADIVSGKCAEASRAICRSFRNDVHHMNPGVVKVPFRDMAKRNLRGLMTIETEIFAAQFAPDGSIILRQPKYWTSASNGKVRVFLRLEPGDGTTNPFGEGKSADK
jgi:hypothetical protein